MHGVDIVIEATGRFRTREAAGAHLTAGARKVVLTSPGTDSDATIVMGVNQDIYDPAAPRRGLQRLLHHELRRPDGRRCCTRRSGSTKADHHVHSYTATRTCSTGRTRTCAGPLGGGQHIPTSTGAARAIGMVLPELAGRFDGIAVRVPVVDGSLVDMTVRLSEPATVAQVNRAFATAADGPLKGILRYTTEPWCPTT